MRTSIVLDQGKQAWPIIISQYASFFLAIQYRDNDHSIIPLTNYTAKMEIRKTTDSNDPPIITLEIGSGLEIDGPNGLVLITITDEQTADFPEIGGQNQGRWDLLITDASGFVTKLLYGPVTVLGTVTKP